MNTRILAQSLGLVPSDEQQIADLKQRTRRLITETFARFRASIDAHAVAAVGRADARAGRASPQPLTAVQLLDLWNRQERDMLDGMGREAAGNDALKRLSAWVSALEEIAARPEAKPERLADAIRHIIESTPDAGAKAAKHADRQPSHNTFSADCPRDIAHFIGAVALMKKHEKTGNNTEADTISHAIHSWNGVADLFTLLYARGVKITFAGLRRFFAHEAVRRNVNIEDVAIWPIPDAVRLLKNKAAGAVPTGTTLNATKGKGKRRGPKKADYETVQREAKLAKEWNKAHNAGTYKGDFARDNKMTISELDKLLGRVRHR